MAASSVFFYLINVVIEDGIETGGDLEYAGECRTVFIGELLDVIGLKHHVLVGIAHGECQHTFHDISVLWLLFCLGRLGTAFDNRNFEADTPRPVHRFYEYRATPFWNLYLFQLLVVLGENFLTSQHLAPFNCYVKTGVPEMETVK